MYFLKTNRLSLVNWSQSGGPDSLSAYFNVVLPGALRVNGWHMESHGPKFKKGWWGQNPAGANLRLGDTPLRRRDSGATGPELEEEVAWGVMEAVWAHTTAIRDFLERRNPGLRDIEDFRPNRWQGGVLAIPVDYARFVHLRKGFSPEEVVTATLQLGYHVLAREVVISRWGDVRLEGLSLEDEGLLERVRHQLCNDSGAVDAIRAARGPVDMKTELLYPFEGYVADAPPPSIQYFPS